jgi:hypothetical protein
VKGYREKRALYRKRADKFKASMMLWLIIDVAFLSFMLYIDEPIGVVAGIISLLAWIFYGEINSHKFP